MVEGHPLDGTTFGVPGTIMHHVDLRVRERRFPDCGSEKEPTVGEVPVIASAPRKRLLLQCRCTKEPLIPAS